MYLPTAYNIHNNYTIFCALEETLLMLKLHLTMHTLEVIHKVLKRRLSLEVGVGRFAVNYSNPAPKTTLISSRSHIRVSFPFDRGHVATLSWAMTAIWCRRSSCVPFSREGGLSSLCSHQSWNVIVVFVLWARFRHSLPPTVFKPRKNLIS